MKYLTVIILFFISFFLSAQNDSIPFINEFGGTINKTRLNDEYSSNRIGYGLIAYHSGTKNKTANFIFGFEYNSIKFHKDIIWAGHFAYYKDLLISVNSLGFPILIRIGIGNRLRFFIELGARLEFRIWSNMKGTFESFYPNSNNQLVHHSEKINTSAALESMTPVDLLPTIGAGIIIKINKVDLLLKTDYRYGFTQLYGNNYRVNNQYMNFSLCMKLNKRLNIKNVFHFKRTKIISKVY